MRKISSLPDFKWIFDSRGGNMGKGGSVNWQVLRKLIASQILMIVMLSATPSSILAQQKTREIILATTTSTQDSGLLDVLIPIFEKKTGYVVKTIAVGSGQAIAMGKRGEADCLLVHSPQAEKEFMLQGFGIDRKLVMHNDFIIVGPEEDPAHIDGLESAPQAFQNIFRAKALFISRGDDSGTHVRERQIWKIAGVNPTRQKWYQQTGLGMGQTLLVASEKGGYCLTDRATYLALRKNLSLKLLLQGDKSLLNIYHVIEVNPARWPKVNEQGARAFCSFMVSEEAQKIIENFGKGRFGQPLFYPDAGKKEEDVGK